MTKNCDKCGKDKSLVGGKIDTKPFEIKFTCSDCRKRNKK